MVKNSCKKGIDTNLPGQSRQKVISDFILRKTKFLYRPLPQFGTKVLLFDAFHTLFMCVSILNDRILF